MPPRSPLPPRDGLTACWVRTLDRDPGDQAPSWPTMRDFLLARLGSHAPVEDMLADGSFVDASGRPWLGSEPYRPNAFVWFHRPLLPESEVPHPLDVLYADDRIVVVDKPHFLATTPRGSHIRESVVFKLRQRLGLPDLVPAHRLDRLTAGVLVLTGDRKWRAAYAGVFAARAATKTYEAIAGHDASLEFPRVVTSRIEKQRGSLQAKIVPGESNAETHIDQLEVRGLLARYRLVPTTGRTHQLRLHLCALGIPIVDDPLYPCVLDAAPDDFTRPLLLVARRLTFDDPVDGRPRAFESRIRLDWPE